MVASQERPFAAVCTASVAKGLLAEASVALGLVRHVLRQHAGGPAGTTEAGPLSGRVWPSKGPPTLLAHKEFCSAATCHINHRNTM